MKTFLLFLIAALATAACSRQPVVTRMTLMSFAFEPLRLVAQQGDTVRLELVNTDSIPHAIDIPKLGIALEVLPGETMPMEFVVDQAGIYSFFCNHPGHHESGMEGVLIVEAEP